ncbi:hypothetical protein ABW19_dt0201056 [Dactylella cylindrospora]|nr:hypothetical protein ABW19_dt0201056 [Dactylella cylindrospora]
MSNEDVNPAEILPFASQLGISQEESDKYEELLISYFEHCHDDDAGQYLQPIIDYLKYLPEPTTESEYAVEMLQDLLGINDSDGPQLGPETVPLPDDDRGLGESFENLGLDAQQQPESKDIGNNPVAKFRILAALNYIEEYSDFTIITGKEQDRVEFKVHTEVLIAEAPGFKEAYEAGVFSKTGVPKSDDPDIDPRDMDFVLAWIYGDPIESLCNPQYPKVSMLNLVKIAHKLQLQKFIIELSGFVGDHIDSPWSFNIFSIIAHLYRYHEVYDTGIQFTVDQLECGIRHIKRTRKMKQLATVLQTVATDQQGEGFFRDMSIALCNILRGYGRPRKSKETPISDSVVVVDARDASAPLLLDLSVFTA